MAAVPWKLIAGVLVVIIVVAGLAWWLWPRGGGETTVTKENVRFDYQMMFTYYGSEENVPLENVVLRWSAPKVDNSVKLLEDWEDWATWELYYIEDDNTLTLQATYDGTVNLRGDRSSQLGMYEFGYANSEHGPVNGAWFDRLYPREVFIKLGHVIVDKETAEEATLKVYGYEGSIGSWYPIGQENQRIDFSIWVGLWRDNVLVEQFQWMQENMTYGWSWLWPVT